MKDNERTFTVLRCHSKGTNQFSKDLIVGSYMGKGGRGNCSFSKAMLMTDQKTVEFYLEAYGADIYEPVSFTVQAPE